MFHLHSHLGQQTDQAFDQSQSLQLAQSFQSLQNYQNHSAVF